MKLHVFNPEHEMALAADLHQFTSPRAGREMRLHLSFLPALWADDGDCVWVDDVEIAQEGLQRIDCQVADVQFVTSKQIPQLSIDMVSPWGWDRSIVHQLKRLQIPIEILPSERQLAGIRAVSSRQWASECLLPALTRKYDELVGSSSFVTSLPPFSLPIVLKSPWSCSGRGVRYAVNEQQYMSHERWAKNVIERQGGIMTEPYYRRVIDFALEFESTVNGINYLGISLFLTNLGGYTGNILASEEYKLREISQYISLSVLENVKDEIIKQMKKYLCDKYIGPFGVDMMIVKEDAQYRLHPCVELNLRRTMGHVALSLQSKFVNPMLMCVKYDGTYHLDISPLKRA